MKKFLVLMLAVVMVFSFAGCVEGNLPNGQIVEEALDNYEKQEPIGATDPENTVDTPAVNADREEQKQEAFYNGEATVTAIDGNKITMSYPGGKQGKTTTVSFSDPEHRYEFNETYVIDVRSFFIKVTQLNPVKQFGRFSIIKAPEDGR